MKTSVIIVINIVNIRYLKILRDFNDRKITFISFRFGNKTIVENPKCLQSACKIIFITHVTRHVINNVRLHYTFTTELFFIIVYTSSMRRVDAGKTYGIIIYLCALREFGGHLTHDRTAHGRFLIGSLWHLRTTTHWKIYPQLHY